MNHSLRLLIAFGVAAAAALSNHAYLQSQLRSEQFAAAKRGLKPATKLSAEDLQPISLSGDVAALREILVSWDRRDEIVGRMVPREIAEHELLTLPTFVNAARQPVPSGKLGIFVPTDAMTMVPAFLRPSMVVYFSIQRDDVSGREETEEDPRMIGPFTVSAIDGVTDPNAQLDANSNRRPTLTIAASPEELKQLEHYRLLQHAVVRNGWKLVALTIYTP